MKRNAWLPAIVAAFAAAFFPISRLNSAPSVPQQSAEINSEIALVGARIYVSPFAVAINNGVIIIRDGKIAAVGHKGSVHVPNGIGRLDCSGMYILAGFQNSNVHFTQPEWNDAAQLPASQLTNQLQDMFTRFGFTNVVDLGSGLQNTLALRKRIESGEVLGPRILTAGAPLYPPNGIPYYVKSTLPLTSLKELPQPATPAEAVQQVDNRIAQGADIIHLFTGSPVARGNIVTMPLAVAQAAVAEAHKKGKLVFASPSNVAGLRIALQSHVDVLAHAVEDTSGWNPDYLKQMKDERMWFIPTLTLFMHDDNLNRILSEVHDYPQAHEDILFGTDAGRLAGYDPTNEYVLMQRAGMDFWHILDTLTAAPATRFGQSDVRGEIKEGMNADLVVINENPETDIRALADVVYTFRDGQVIYSASGQ